MPLRKKVDSLSTVCLKNIAKNIDKYWFDEVDRDFGENPHFLYVVGPFECLSGEQVQQLIYILSSIKGLRRQHLYVLISERLKTIDLSQSSIIANNGLILKSIAYRCRKLTSLNISNCSGMPAGAIANAVRELSFIKYLGLSSTKINDGVMSVIAESCPMLLSLEIASTPVTDAGVRNLCGMNLKDGPKCKLLVKIDAKASKIGMTGAKLIMTTFKRLQMFGFADVVEAVKQVIESNDLENGEPLKLSHLSASGVKCQHISLESLAIAALSCPFVTEVFLYRGATNENIQYLRELKHLKSLKITSDMAGDVTFTEGLLPLLKVRGNNLQYLGLYDVDKLDICSIGLFCQNIEKLKICMPMFNDVKFVSSYTKASQNCHNAFSHLKQFWLVIGEDDSSFPVEDFSFLLQKALGLAEIHLTNLQCLTDSLLKRILFLNPLFYLEELEMENCHNISDNSIWQLLRCENLLKHLTLTRCKEITRKNFDQFRKHAKHQNLELTISGNIL